MWCAQAVEQTVRGLEYLVRVRCGDVPLPAPDLPLAQRELKGWRQAERDLCRRWPEDIPRPTDLRRRLGRIRDLRNTIAHAIPGPLFMAMVGLSPHDEPYADLQYLIETSGQVLAELMPCLAWVADLDDAELDLGSLGIMSVLIDAPEGTGTVDATNLEAEMDRLVTLAPKAAPGIAKLLNHQ